jgi:glutathione synthase/RimK-type ligase-like ATP-grasp enzyme
MGNGIVKFTNAEDMEYYRTQQVNIEKVRTTPHPHHEVASNHFQHKNGFWILQEYITPVNDLIYRVWVTGGKIECSISVSHNTSPLPSILMWVFLHVNGFVLDSNKQT